MCKRNDLPGFLDALLGFHRSRGGRSFSDGRATYSFNAIQYSGHKGGGGKTEGEG